MSQRKHAICVSTSKPSTSLTPGGGGGSTTLLCPYTGSVLSSFRPSGGDSSKSALGMFSLSAFPNKFSHGSAALIMAYGGSQRKDDTYGMLITLRRAPLSPLLHWKCRLPEDLLAGLVVSRCGHYIAGGGSSGTCYVWNALGGSLIRTVRAHYRSVTAIEWSACGLYLVTGGGDGVVHVFSLLDLVDVEIPEGKTITPLRTRSYHHLSVTTLKALPNDRMASASDDCKVAIVELFSDAVVLTVQMPHSIHVLDYAGGRLFAGATQGSIYTIDLEVYAMHQTSKLGITVKRPDVEETSEDQIFGHDSDTDLSFKSELHGHSKSITSLAVIEDRSSELLVSGDEGGTLRVWDLESRSCTRILEPWSHSVAASGSKTIPQSAKKSANHPVTAILVIPRGDDSTDQQPFSLGDFGNSGTKESSKTQNSIVSLVTPLQKFKQDLPEDGAETCIKWTPVPFSRPFREAAAMEFWNRSVGSTFEAMSTKRRKLNKDQEETLPLDSEAFQESGEEERDGVEEDRRKTEQDPAVQLQEEKEEVQKLRAELEEAKNTIQRWESVNNKLVAKLKKVS